MDSLETWDRPCPLKTRWVLFDVYIHGGPISRFHPPPLCSLERVTLVETVPPYKMGHSFKGPILSPHVFVVSSVWSAEFALSVDKTEKFLSGKSRSCVQTSMRPQLTFVCSRYLKSRPPRLSFLGYFSQLFQLKIMSFHYVSVRQRNSLCAKMLAILRHVIETHRLLCFVQEFS